jgi:hypothetical protein
MTEKETFDAAMKKILSVSKQELQRRLEAEKAAKTPSSRVRDDKD